MNCRVSTIIGIFVCMLFQLAARSASAVLEPQEAGIARNQAMRDARAANWASALDSCSVYYEKLTVRHGRDRKLFTWIVEEFLRDAQRRGRPPDFDALKATVDAKVAESAERPLILWRLHVLKADIARSQKDLDAYELAMAEAIKVYPEITYPDPPTQDYLHTLYNELALLAARDDLPKAEETILKQFVEDRRFVYFDIERWRAFHRGAAVAQRTADFAKRVINAYTAKIEATPDLADVLTWYKLQLVEIHGQLLDEKLRSFR